MRAGRALAHARKRMGFTQRQLAARAGVPQSVIGRVERGRVSPRVDTLQRLLAACGASLEALPALGIGLDRSQIRARLHMTPTERLRLATQEARALVRLLARQDRA